MGSIFGGGGSSGTATSSTSNDVTVNTQTDVNIDLVPLGEILAQSQELVANTDKETAKINIINAELDRKANEKALSTLDGYLEHAKNGLILFSIVGSGLYLYKNNPKKRRKKKK